MTLKQLLHYTCVGTVADFVWLHINNTMPLRAGRGEASTLSEGVDLTHEKKLLRYGVVV